ncbi:MAG TPA: hypothetical protein VHG35_10990 [Gemmatimonadales bacterium]|nr:hypothetical protein [Gemmatimonadales bacterium]
MSSLSSRMCTHALTVVALSLASTTASAQSQADADLKAISATTLTLPKYKQYLDATVNLANVAAKDPNLAARLDGYGEKSLSEQVKLLDGVPQVRGAISATGLTTRDYVLTQGALLQAGMAYAMTKGTGVPVDSVVKKAGVSRANLEFYQKNEAEIGRLAKEAEARAPKLPDDDGGEVDDGYDDAGEDVGDDESGQTAE